VSEPSYWSRSRQSRSVSRRSALGLAAAGATGVFLAACSSSSNNNNGNKNTSTSNAAASASSAAGGAATAAATSASRATAAPQAPGGAPAGTPVTTDTPTRGGTLRTGTFLNVLGIDPHIEVSIGLTWDTKIYTYLGGFSSNNQKFNPIFAQSVEQPGPTDFVFKLRQGVKFHNVAPVNGREQTSADVLYSLQRFRDLPQAQNNDFYKTVVDKMEAVDPYTFHVTTKAPYAESLSELGSVQTAIVPHEAVEKFGDLSANAIGAGPYILDQYVKGEKTNLKRNPDYFDKTLPYPDAYNAVTILDTNTLIQAYKSDQIDINGAILTKLDYQDLQKNTKLVNSVMPALFYGSLGMNASTKPFNDPRVRQAIYVGIDRSQFIDKVGQGDGTPMGPLSNGLNFWAISQDQLKPYIGPDVKKAKDLLTAAGYSNGLDLTIETSGGVQLYIDHANVLVSELKKIGINATLHLTDLSSYLSDTLFKGNFTATVFTNNPYESPKIPLGFYTKNGIGGGSWWHYDNEQISAAIDAENAELDINKRQQLVKDVQLKLLDDSAPLLNFFSLVQYNSFNKRVGGYDPTLRTFQSFRNSEFIRANS
jgi:peptide/nickel transport system substrate-binding protein